MLKLNPYNSLIILISTYMLTTLTYTLWPISSPNRIIGFLIFFNVLLIYCMRLTKKKCFILFLLLVVVCWSLINTERVFEFATDAVYLLISILLLIELNFYHSKQKILCALNSSERFIKYLVIICDIILCIGFFDARCYDSSQWDGVYFIGYTNASHTLASGACLLLVLSLFIIRNKRNIWAFIYFVPAISAILRSGARTFLIPILIVCIFFYTYNIRKISIKLIILPIAIVLAFYIFINSSMIEKFSFSVNNQYTNMDFLGKLTNGRTSFWLVDLMAYHNYNIIQKLLGNGFHYVYLVNEEFFNLSIWAHNDYINCLLSVGLVGTFLYIYSLYLIAKKIIKIQENAIFVKILLLLYVILPSFLNGFYTYQHYFYSFIILIILYEGYFCNVRRENI